MIYYLQTDLQCDSNAAEIMDVDLNHLNSISIARQFDATFIRSILESLYKENLEALGFRSYSGLTTKSKKGSKSEKGEFKAISPAKKTTLFKMFRNRVMHANISTHEKIERLQPTNVSRLVALAIGNVRRTLSGATALT